MVKSNLSTVLGNGEDEVDPGAATEPPSSHEGVPEYCAAAAAVGNLPTSNQCHLCDRVFNSEHGLKTHLDLQHDQDVNDIRSAPDKSPDSGMGRNDDYIDDDQVLESVIDVTNTFPCDVCNLTFGSASQAATHSAMVHLPDPRKRLVVCDICLRVFPNGFQMRTHRRVFHIPLKCKVCVKFYTRSADRLGRHEEKCENKMEDDADQSQVTEEVR